MKTVLGAAITTERQQLMLSLLYQDFHPCLLLPILFAKFHLQWKRLVNLSGPTNLITIKSKPEQQSRDIRPSLYQKHMWSLLWTQSFRNLSWTWIWRIFGTSKKVGWWMECKSSVNYHQQADFRSGKLLGLLSRHSHRQSGQQNIMTSGEIKIIGDPDARFHPNALISLAQIISQISPYLQNTLSATIKLSVIVFEKDTDTEKAIAKRLMGSTGLFKHMIEALCRDDRASESTSTNGFDENPETESSLSSTTTSDADGYYYSNCSTPPLPTALNILRTASLRSDLLDL